MPEQNAVIVEPTTKESPVPEYEALAKEIAAKYGVKPISAGVRDIVATYEFVQQTVDADNVPLVFAAITQRFFKG